MSKMDNVELNEQVTETNGEEQIPPQNKFLIEPREKGIYIPFDEIFKRDVSAFNYLVMHRRIQHNQAELIAEDYNVIMDDDEKLYYKLLGFIYDVRIERQTLTQEEFEEYTIEFIKENPVIMERITDYIEDNYTLNLNSRSKANNVNTELQVTDETNKVFLKGTMLMRFVIPLTCVYESRFEDKVNLDFFNLYANCLKLFSNTKDPNAIINKLHKLVYSRLVRTKYSDKVIWGYIRQKSDDVNVTAISITRNIVNTVLLKTKNNTSIVSFLDVVIRKKIKFLFEYNYAISYKSIKVNSSKELEEKEKIEIHHLRRDEGRDKLNDLSIRMKCKEIMNQYGFEVPEDIDMSELNSIQLFIMEQYYSDFALRSQCDKNKYILYQGLLYELDEANLTLMSTIMQSDIAEPDRKNVTRKRIINRIIDNPKYDDILNQYSYVSNLFRTNNIVRALIDIRNNNFIYDGESVEIPLEEFIVEVIKFINML